MRWDVLVGQIDAGHRELVPDGQPSPGSKPAWDKGLPPATALEDARPAGDAVLKSLYIADSALGKAFVLGRKLHEMCATPSRPPDQSPRDVGQSLAAYGDDLRLLLRDLASKLPPNTAHTVLNSLSLWKWQIDPGDPQKTWTARLRRKAKPIQPAAGVDPAECFIRQAFVWYSILAGEVKAKDLLRMSDYVGSAEEMLGRLRGLFFSAMRGKLRWLFVVVLLLFGLGIFVLVKWDSAASAVAGATSVIAALGLSWKGIGEFFGRAAAKGEQALWDAQMDWTIAYRCTVRIDEPGGDEHARNWSINDHFLVWQRWQRQSPDLARDLSRRSA
jgi:hypothetical protein